MISRSSGASAASSLVLIAVATRIVSLHPGGNAVAFDWRILAGRTWKRPWLLSGGLDVANVARAVEISGTRMVDAASGIETAPGKKDPALIKAFLEELASL